jgi:MYXO-CTERM domain-containing protein
VNAATRFLVTAGLGLFGLASSAFAQSSTVLWYDGNGGTDSSSGDFVTHVSTSLAGTVVKSDDWSTLTLSDYRFIVIGRPTVDFDAGQVADLEAYLDDGGYVVVVGDTANAAPNAAGAINDLLTGLGRTMQMEEGYSYIQPVDVNTGQPECRPAFVATSTALIDQNQPLSMISCGSIVPGSGSVLMNYSRLVEATLFEMTLVVEEDAVLLVSDYDFFSDDTCGVTAKESFWTSLWNIVCDIDEDGVANPACGGFDCDDRDDSVGQDLAWLDLDGDGYGDDDLPAPCDPDGVPLSGDCDDDDPDVNPDALEVCDGIDNDCENGADVDVDEGPIWYPDFDGDGQGADGDVNTLMECDQPGSHVDVQGDCDDTNANVYSGRAEICGNNVDDNCNGTTDEGCSGGTTPATPPGDPDCGCSASPASSLPLLAMMGLGVLGFRRRARP